MCTPALQRGDFTKMWVKFMLTREISADPPSQKYELFMKEESSFLFLSLFSSPPQFEIRQVYFRAFVGRLALIHRKQ